MAEPLTFLTWNLAMLARSAEAPPGWSQEHTELEIRRIVLDAQPDVVLFQELPGLVPYVETHDMVKANPKSHSGHLATLVRHELLARLGQPAVHTIPGCAILTTFAVADPGLTVANVHLAPGSGAAAAATRLDQLARVVEASPTPHIAIVGDTNTRTDELDALAGADLHSPRPPRSTWNSRSNRFHRGGRAFTAFFTRAITGPGVRLGAQQVLDRPIELDHHRFHLSDHFGLRGELIVDAPRGPK